MPRLRPPAAPRSISWPAARPAPEARVDRHRHRAVFGDGSSTAPGRHAGRVDSASSAASVCASFSSSHSSSNPRRWTCCARSSSLREPGRASNTALQAPRNLSHNARSSRCCSTKDLALACQRACSSFTRVGVSRSAAFAPSASASAISDSRACRACARAACSASRAGATASRSRTSSFFQATGSTLPSALSRQADSVSRSQRSIARQSGGSPTSVGGVRGGAPR